MARGRFPIASKLHGISMQCDAFGIKEMLYNTRSRQKKSPACIFCEKWTLSENVNNYSPGLPYVA